MAKRAVNPYSNLQFASQVDWKNADQSFLAVLNVIARQRDVTIDVFSAYRSPDYSAKVGGYSNDPHTRHVAVDANVNGKPIGEVIPQEVFAQYGLESGNQPGFYRGKTDPSHVQVVGSGVDKSITSYRAPAGRAARTSPPVETGDPAEAFWSKTLDSLGAQPTKENIAYLASWSQREGTAALNNPLATTQHTAGSYDLPGNSAHVQQYASVDEGATATAQTLLNGRYKTIVAALRSGSPFAYQKQHPEIAGELSTWSGAGYTAVPESGGSTSGHFSSVAAAAPAAVAPTDTPATAPAAPSYPAIMPPPSSSQPLPGGGPQLPGSVTFTLDRQQVAQNWQTLANQYPASRSVQQYAYLSGLGVDQ